MAIWRIETCKAEAGYRSNASIYSLIREGLWTNPVPIGRRSVGWPDNEVRVLCAARIAGKADGEIRELVSRLHAKRAELLAIESGEAGTFGQNGIAAIRRDAAIGDPIKTGSILAGQRVKAASKPATDAGQHGL